MLELQTSLFRALIGRDCDGCHAGLKCWNPYALNGDGLEIAGRSTGEDIVVGWPHCPLKWLRLRRMGAGLMPLSAVVSWAVERGLHKRERMSAWAARLMRHYIRSSEAPTGLSMARDRHEAELSKIAATGVV